MVLNLHQKLLKYIFDWIYEKIDDIELFNLKLACTSLLIFLCLLLIEQLHLK